MKFWTNKWLLLLILTLTWGSSFIMIKQSLKAFHPMQVGALRLSIAGLALVGFGIGSFKYIPKKLIKWVVIGGCLGNFIPMFLFPFAQQKVSSATAGILDSLVPIFVLIFGFLIFGFKSSKTQILGAIIGFGGAFLLIKNGGTKESSDFLFSMLIVLATIFYGLNGLIISKYLSELPSFRLSAAVFTIWLGPSLVILGFSGFFNEFTASSEQLRGLGFVAILGLIGTATAMILYYKLIQMTSAIFASTVTYLMPVIAVMWGFLDGEKLTWLHICGGMLILIGVYLIQVKTEKPKNIKPSESIKI
ncbi:MAG: DMT family transporter [Moheibacter sp.]